LIIKGNTSGSQHAFHPRVSVEEKIEMQIQTREAQGQQRQASRFLAVVFCLFGGFRQAHAQSSTATPETGVEIAHSRKIVVSIPHRKLALIQDGKVQKIYSVAVGAGESPSPTGTFVVKTRVVKPTYYHPGKVIPNGPANPLGTRWIGLSTKGYGIHGTNVESSVGKPASHGCIRMHRKDLEQLFASVQVGDQVEIRDAGDGELASIFGELASASRSTEAVASGAVNAQ
jgi:lipoprotein-anchoring transpeptidase ErfK/SrfK